MNSLTTNESVSMPFSADDVPSQPVASDEETQGRSGIEASDSARRQQAIRESVFMLLQKTDRTEERRWKPRILFVRPAVILLEDAGSDQSGADTTSAQPASTQQTNGLSRMDVVTTDISTRGVGVLSPTELPDELLVLRFPEVDFLCEAQWSEQVGPSFHRHGLTFKDILETRTG